MLRLFFLVFLLSLNTSKIFCQSESDSLEISENASFYHDRFQGQETSSGETYNKNDFTAAHKTLPMNTVVKVDNLDNGKSIIVRINDRGPFIKGRDIDLSKSAFFQIAPKKYGGSIKVKLKIIK